MEQQGVGWSTDEVSSCVTMEQFLDYLELRLEAGDMLEVLAGCTAPEGPAGRTPHPRLLVRVEATSTTADRTSC